MFDWVYALIGFLIMFGVLVGIGINQPRGTSMKTWCYGYLAISIGFDVLVIITLVNASQYVWLNNLLLGLSAGAATGLGIHVAHHIAEEDGHDENAKEKQPSMFGF
jgi:ABC-type Co2+ transport system permease subunit